MQYALVNDERREPEPGLSGICASCGSLMVSKCGEVNIHHWAHGKRRNCDPWWENETEWHRAWKRNFPTAWHEVIQKDEIGEKHIADVKTSQGIVLEFQHSHIKPEERDARENFYKNMVWIVDGKRRLRDKEQFQFSIRYTTGIGARKDLFESTGGGALSREWGNRNVPVFFDFGEEMLWGYLPKNLHEKSHVVGIERSKLIAALGPDSKVGIEGLYQSFLGTLYAHDWRLKRMKEIAGQFPFGIPQHRGRWR